MLGIIISQAGLTFRVLCSRSRTLWQSLAQLWGGDIGFVQYISMYVRMFTFCHVSSTYIYWWILIYLHTNVGYDNISSRFDFQGPGLKVKVTDFFYNPPHNSDRVLWFHVGHLCVCPSVRHPSICPSVFRFPMITWVNISGFSPNLACALILWRSRLGLLMGKFRQIFTELYARDTPIFLFPDDNLSK